jgi:hypothetical protein
MERSLPSFSSAFALPISAAGDRRDTAIDCSELNNATTRLHAPRHTGRGYTP